MIARHKLRPDYATPVALGHANIFNKMFGCCHKSQRCCNKTLRCCRVAQGCCHGVFVFFEGVFRFCKMVQDNYS